MDYTLKSSKRFPVLVLSSFVCFGSYFVSDIPTSLQFSMMRSLELDELQFNLLYLVTSLPNIFVPFISGMLLDFVKLRYGIVFLAGLVAYSQLVIFVGSVMSSYNAVLVGRFLYGIGGESLFVAMISFASRWFIGKELALAIGLCIGIPKIGTLMNFGIVPYITTSASDLSTSLLLCLLVSFLSLICAIILFEFDKPYSIENEKSDQQTSRHCLLPLNLSPLYWLILANSILIFVTDVSTNYLNNGYFPSKYNCKSYQTVVTIYLSFYLAAITFPIVGVVVDRLKNRSVFILASTISVSVMHVVLTLNGQGGSCFTGIYISSALGLCYVVYCLVVYSSIPLIVPEGQLATAFGLLISGQNLSLSFTSLIADLQDYEDLGALSVFISVGVAALATAIILTIKDYKSAKCLWTSKFDTYKPI